MTCLTFSLVKFIYLKNNGIILNVKKSLKVVKSKCLKVIDSPLNKVKFSEIVAEFNVLQKKRLSILQKGKFFWFFSFFRVHVKQNLIVGRSKITKLRPDFSKCLELSSTIEFKSFIFGSHTLESASFISAFSSLSFYWIFFIICVSYALFIFLSILIIKHSSLIIWIVFSISNSSLNFDLSIVVWKNEKKSWSLKISVQRSSKNTFDCFD